VEKIRQEVIKELRVCKNPDCKKEFEANIIKLAGVSVSFGNQYCPECRKRILEEQEAREKAAQEAEIASKRRRWREQLSGIPAKFMTSEFGNFNEKHVGCQGLADAKKRCQEYADKWPFPDMEGSLGDMKRATPLYSSTQILVGE